MKYLKTLALAITLALGLTVAGAALAQEFPNRELRIIVPFGVGTHDFAARQVAKTMGDLLRQTVVVENRASSGGVIGAHAAATAQADGYTLFAGTVGTQVINPLLRKSLNYDPDKQFIAVGLVSRIPSILAVRATLPVNTLDEFIAYAKAQGSKMTYAATGTLHLGIENLKATHGLHARKIPFKSANESATAVAAGQVDMMMDSASTLAPYFSLGRIKPIAVMGDARLKRLPEVPTTKELHQPALQASNWTGLFVPTGTPALVIERLNSALRTALISAELRDSLATVDAQVFEGSFEEYAALLARDKEKVKRLIAFAQVSPQ